MPKIGGFKEGVFVCTWGLNFVEDVFRFPSFFLMNYVGMDLNFVGLPAAIFLLDLNFVEGSFCTWI